MHDLSNCHEIGSCGLPLCGEPAAAGHTLQTVVFLSVEDASHPVSPRDAEDRTCLHYAAGYGHEECVSLLLEARSDTRVRDANGDVPLHFAAIHGHPMCAYNITKVWNGTPRVTIAVQGDWYANGVRVVLVGVHGQVNHALTRADNVRSTV